MSFRSLRQQPLRSWLFVITFVFSCSLLTLTTGCARQAIPGRTQFRSSAAMAPERSIRLVNGPGVDKVSPTSALIWWTTDIPSSAVVYYGTSPSALSEQITVAARKHDHIIKVANLRPGTKYYFRVRASRDGAMAKTSGMGQFETRDSSGGVTVASSAAVSVEGH
jgi:phosphodiesterase/alkaline phosphatase D-like protein